MEQTIINLDKYKSKNSRVFSGRDRGEAVRNQLKLDLIENSQEGIIVQVPLETISINNSFFLGLFGSSVRRLTEQGFRNKYIFKASKSILKNVEEGIARALKEESVI